MKTVRKCSALLLAMVMVLSLTLTGCGKKEEIAQPDVVAEAIFELVIKNDAAKATQVMGYASEEEARQDLMGSDGDIYEEMAEEIASQFEAMGATVTMEDVQALVDATITMLGKLDFSAQVKEMDEKAGTAVVTAHIGCYDSDALNSAMEEAMTEVMADPELMAGLESGDTDALFSAIFQKIAQVMSSLEPTDNTADFDVDFELSTLTSGSKSVKAWLPVDAEQFGMDLSAHAMGA